MSCPGWRDPGGEGGRSSASNGIVEGARGCSRAAGHSNRRYRPWFTVCDGRARPAARRGVNDVWAIEGEVVGVSLVMGMDQHRAQISAEWIDTITGEVSRARVAPADRAGVRKFLARFAGEGLEVALEATTGWRFVVEELERVGAEVHLAEPAETSGAEGQEEAREDRLGRRPASARAVADRPAAGVVDRAAHISRPPRPGPDAAIRSRTSGRSGSSGSTRCSITTASRSAATC